MVNLVNGNTWLTKSAQRLVSYLTICFIVGIKV